MTKQDILREFEKEFPVLQDLFLNREKQRVMAFLSQALDELAGELVGAVKIEGYPNCPKETCANHLGSDSKNKCQRCNRIKYEQTHKKRFLSALLARCREMGLEVK